MNALSPLAIALIVLLAVFVGSQMIVAAIAIVKAPQYKKEQAAKQWLDERIGIKN